MNSLHIKLYKSWLIGISNLSNLTRSSDLYKFHHHVGLSTDDIIAKFPHNTLPRIEGEPTYESINEMSQYIYVNAATLPISLGGGQHRHIGLIMKPSLYAKLSSTGYVTSNNPGHSPNIPSNATTSQRQTIRE